MTQDYSYTDSDIGFQINNATLNIRVNDTERSSSDGAVNVVVTFEIEVDSNGEFVLQYREMDYPGDTIKPRDFTLLEGVANHLKSLGIPVSGCPSTVN